jgi:fused signal recognition particle receptor
MVFNWFRRQHSDAKETSQEQPTPTPEVQPEEPLAESDSSPKSSEEVAQDYLTWAKAAYKNIQARQQSQPTAETPAAAKPETPAAETEPVTEAAQSVEVEAIAPIPEMLETEAVTEPTAPETSDAIAPTPPDETLAEAEPEPAETSDAIALTPPDETLAAAEPEEPAETPIPTVPFWAKKEDRQARLERLIETAIEEPEPELQPVAVTAASEVEEAMLGLAFDEGFLWSSEVLAAQGRRPEDISFEEITWLKKLRQGLDKTRRNLINQLKAIVGQGPLNQDAVAEIEALLLQADVGVEATDYIINSLQSKLREEALPPDAAIAYLKQILRGMLDTPLQKSHKPTFVPEKDTLNIWLITGVNGAGKTTTIGKIAHIAQKSGYKCLIGAADTFRAAAVEQVKVWGKRSGVEVIANPGPNTDPAAVVFDAIAAAQSRETELLLIDTAGRLQNKKNLMDELGKIRRIIDKKAEGAIVESLLVLDATLGQNGLRQAQVFSEVAQLSGVVLTKLDGTAKGGVALAVVQQLGLPIRFIGAGEGIEDLRPFSSYEFVEALLSG